MCGIAGIFNFNGRPVQQAELKRMTDAIAHRGPDGEGFYMDGPLGLGHRRLAILDLSDTGKQPMEYARGRYWITFNGEIYNFLEIAEELKAKGYVFKSSSDTEVVLAAYDCWGPECLPRFNGMWAFAIWDKSKKILFLSRDRMGVKPLFLYRTATCLVFASEIKAIISLSHIPRRPYPPVITEILLGGTGDRCMETAFEGITRLRAGVWLKVCLDGRQEERQWWDLLENLPTIPKKPTEQIEHFKELFADACRIRLRADVPIGTLLSGGLDSSSILCMIAHDRRSATSGNALERLTPDWQRAYTAEYPGLSADETEYAQAAADKAAISPVKIRPTITDLPMMINRLIQMQDVPIDAGLIAVHAVYASVAEHGTQVTLDGQGADEYLSGYSVIPAACDYLLLGRLYELDMTIRHQTEMTTATGGYFRVLKEVIRQVQRERFPLRTAFRSFIGKPPRLAKPITPYGVTLPALREEASNPLKGPQMQLKSFLARSSFTALYQAPLPSILRKYDHAAMASSVESRMPFLDWRLVTYGFALPLAMKVSGGFSKWVLREAMKGIIPEKVRLRRSKFGFPVPEEWLGGPIMQGWIRDLMDSQSFSQSEFWDAQSFRKWFESRTQDGRWTGSDLGTIFSILTTHVWLESVIAGRQGP